MNKPSNTDEQKLHNILMRASHHGHKPFCVPKDYFTDLQPRIMAQVQQQAQSADTSKELQIKTDNKPHDRSIFALLRFSLVRISAAAMLAGVFAVTGTMLYKQIHPSAAPITADTSISMSAFSDTEYYDDDILDYAMLDNSDIEYYLTSAE